MKFDFLKKIMCFTRSAAGDQSPADILSRIEKASVSPSEMIKEITNQTEIKRTMKVNIAPWGDLCLQEYKWDPRRVIVSPFRLSRGERIWKFHDEIVKGGVFVPEPVLLLEIRAFLFTTKTYVATRWIEGASSLALLASEEAIQESIDPQEVLFMCTEAVANLHNAGFIHGDLKWSNLLFVRNPAQYVALIDLDSLRKTSSLRRQGRDFGRFLIPPKNCRLGPDMIDRLTERYLERRGHPKQLEKIIRAYVAKKKK